MNVVASILMVIWLCLCCGGTQYQPSTSEVSRAFAFQTPSSSWGYQARQQRDLRLFAIGGSNTRFDNFYYYTIHDFDNVSSHPSWNGTMNKIGLGGVHGGDVISMKFPFEQWNYSVWPNVIMLEFSANIDTWKTSTLDEDLDTIIALVRKKYAIVRVPEPSIMFLELFSVRHLVHDMNTHSNATVDEKMALLSSLSGNESCLSRHSTFCPNYFAVRRIAAYYDLPIVSWRELAYNAFVRYYLASNTSFKVTRWEYMADGLHITSSAGKLLYDTLLGPFYRQIMTPRKEPPWDEHQYMTMNSSRKRLYPPSNRTLELMPHGWGGVDFFQLARPPLQWYLMQPHEHEKFLCSSSQRDSVILDFNIPLECNEVDTCTVSVGFLHSWNTSYTGHLSCELLCSEGKMIEKVRVNTTLNEDGDVMKHTHGVRTYFHSTLKAGNFSVACSKLDENLTCVTSFGALSVMEV